MMSAKEATQLKRLIAKRVRAEVDHSWKGAQEPAVAACIKLELEKSKNDLNLFIKERTLR